jgi:hypothetical protein
MTLFPTLSEEIENDSAQFQTIIVEEKYNGSCKKVGYAIVHIYEKARKKFKLNNTNR